MSLIQDAPLRSRARPRWATPRRAERPTRGSVDRSIADMLGWSLFPWQVDLADVAGEYYPESRLPCYRTVGVSVARQNGKTTIVCVRIARQLIPPRQTVAYTAQDRGLARTKWEEHVDILMQTPFAQRVARVDRTNHREMLVMRNGSRYMPVTPSGRKAARSLSIDLAVIDEAHAHDDMSIIGALNPTMAARPHAQIWLLSNAGDSRSGLWRHYTDTGRLEVANPASTVCWVEYCPSDDADMLDRQAWADANPSLDLPGGVGSAALLDSATTMDAETFRREHLNVWADSALVTGIDAVTWAACRDDELLVEDQVAIGLDFTPERDRGALVVVGLVGDRTPIEVIEASSDLDSLVTRAAELANRWEALIIIDRGGPAASTIPSLERATAYGRPAPITHRHGVAKGGDRQHRVRLISLPDVVRACGDFHDAAVTARLAHRGDYRLNDAVASATKRKVGDGWAWKRRGGADISPLVAATLARWGVVTAPPPPPPPVATVTSPLDARVNGNGRTARPAPTSVVPPRPGRPWR